MTSLWRYEALAPEGRQTRRGEMAGESAAQVRASLRRLNLQVIQLREVRAWRWPSLPGLSIVQDRLHRHLRRRRMHIRAELFDGLATMLDAGVPLIEAVETILDSARQGRRNSSIVSMLTELRERLRSGASFDQAMAQGRQFRGWFEPAEVAMVRAAQHGGTLPIVLRTLANRHEQAGDLQHKLISATAYPAVIAAVGLGVTVFLSVKTLPDLTRILTDAKVPVPGLTRVVMNFGQAAAHHWLAILMLLLVLAGLLASTPVMTRSLGAAWRRRVQRLRPVLVRRLALARVSAQLADLVKAGVPLLEAMRVAAPTCPAELRSTLLEAAARVERGDDLASAFEDPLWFDAEFRRLIELGQSSGELDSMLQRVGERYERRARRLIERLAAMLEPCVILVLAVLVGVVAMAAILPLVRLQEILK